MPTYQYACNACKHEFEVFQAFTDTSLTHCPECGGELRKVYSAVGVVFKGSGFYKTDSKTDSKGDSKSLSKSETTSSSPSTAEKPATPAPEKPSTPAASASE